jgi:hypothetical protein
MTIHREARWSSSFGRGDTKGYSVRTYYMAQTLDQMRNTKPLA